jgi:dipeptidyl aminopeptidase/acylaminoacyl peptidase
MWCIYALNLCRPNRLLIAHGLLDENVHIIHSFRLLQALDSQKKPYRLQIYRGERHGLRQREAVQHFETLFLDFINKALN